MVISVAGLSCNPKPTTNLSVGRPALPPAGFFATSTTAHYLLADDNKLGKGTNSVVSKSLVRLALQRLGPLFPWVPVNPSICACAIVPRLWFQGVNDDFYCFPCTPDRVFSLDGEPFIIDFTRTKLDRA